MENINILFDMRHFMLIMISFKQHDVAPSGSLPWLIAPCGCDMNAAFLSIKY